MDTPPLRQLTHPLVHRSLLPLLSTEMFPRYRLTAIATLSTSFSWTALDIISPSHALSTWTFHGWCPRSKRVFSWELRIMEYWIALSRDDESAWIDGSSHGATSSRCFCFRLHLLVPISVALMAPQLWSASLPSPGLLKLLWPCRKNQRSFIFMAAQTLYNHELSRYFRMYYYHSATCSSFLWSFFPPQYLNTSSKFIYKKNTSRIWIDNSFNFFRQLPSRGYRGNREQRTWRNATSRRQMQQTHSYSYSTKPLAEAGTGIALQTKHLIHGSWEGFRQRLALQEGSEEHQRPTGLRERRLVGGPPDGGEGQRAATVNLSPSSNL